MKSLIKFSINALMATAAIAFTSLSADNQTSTLSPVLPQTSLPFTIKIEQASFNLPAGLQSFAKAIYDNKWVLISGRTNGMHSFDSPPVNNFPPNFQNTTVYVIDPKTGNSWSRSLKATSSGLTQSEVDSLSVTAAEFCQKGDFLYLVGGYGINTQTGKMETKKTLTKIDLKKLVHWVKHANPTAKEAINQVSDSFLQVTGGEIFPVNNNSFLLVFGQNFAGLYSDNSNGTYTMKVRKFRLSDDNGKLSIKSKAAFPSRTDYRRRDLNIVPVIHKNKPAFTAFAGVFTPTDGVWTVPVKISTNGTSSEPNPNKSSTFKQAMNQYVCAAFGLYSTKSQDMYEVLAGGISYGFFSNGTFQIDPEIPFINQVTTIKIDRHQKYKQYLMDGEYPVIISTGPNPGQTLLFGAGAEFFPASGIPLFKNGVINSDKLPNKPIVIGYIAGGIMSSVPNTSNPSDSTSSHYVFTVKLTPKSD